MEEKIISYGFCLILFIFMIVSIFSNDKVISFTERRKLASSPELIIDRNVNMDYFKELDKYLIDQFPLRDELRKVKAMVSYNLLNKMDNNKIFIEGDMVFQLNPVINRKAVVNFTEKLQMIKDKYLNNNNRIYYSIIPDKNYYLEDKVYPKLDYDDFINTVKLNLNSSFNYIDITNTLALDSYYNTDIHWKQESLNKVAKTLVTGMKLDFVDDKFEVNEYNSFYGSLYGQSALNLKPDVINYLTNSILDAVKVYNYEKNKYEGIYTTEYLKNIDAYDVFLSGATPLLVLDNENQTNGKELVIFRDSFTSSLAPLLISSYSKITLVDLRYISTELVADKVAFIDADILFLYSVPIINNSFILK
ncbi:MAG: DHHW family protein [Bacilli bacterium]